MKTLKYFLYLILLVIIGGAIYFGLKNGDYDVPSTTNINAPAAFLYEEVNNYKTWAEWGPWMDEDPNIQMTFAEQTQGIGASYSWKSEAMGDGKLQTDSLDPNKALYQTITFFAPWGESKSDIYWKFSAKEDGSTDVTWGMKGTHSLIEKAFMAFQSNSFESTIRAMHQKGLSKLDSLAQKKMAAYTINIDGVTDYSGGYYMYITTAAQQSDLASVMGSLYGKIGNYMASNAIPAAGMPFTIYHKTDEKTGSMILSCAIPVKERVITPKGSSVLCGYTPPLRALKLLESGEKEKICKVYV